MEGQIKTIIFGILGCLLVLCLSELEAKELSKNIENELEAGSLEESFQAADQCKCKNGFCEKNSEGKLVCECPPEWGFNPHWDGCTKCDCGKGVNCTFTGTLFASKTCICKKGYFLEKNICKKCNCGKDFNCKFNFFGTKTCLCEAGYTEQKGVCVAVSTIMTPMTRLGSTTYPPLTTLKEFPPTPEPEPSTMASSTETEKMTAPSSTESSTETTRGTTTSPTLELIKSLVVKILIYEKKI